MTDRIVWPHFILVALLMLLSFRVDAACVFAWDYDLPAWSFSGFAFFQGETEIHRVSPEKREVPCAEVPTDNASFAPVTLTAYRLLPDGGEEMSQRSNAAYAEIVAPVSFVVRINLIGAP